MPNTRARQVITRRSLSLDPPDDIRRKSEPLLPSATESARVDTPTVVPTIDEITKMFESKLAAQRLDFECQLDQILRAQAHTSSSLSTPAKSAKSPKCSPSAGRTAPDQTFKFKMPVVFSGASSDPISITCWLDTFEALSGAAPGPLSQLHRHALLHGLTGTALAAVIALGPTVSYADIANRLRTLFQSMTADQAVDLFEKCVQSGPVPEHVVQFQLLYDQAHRVSRGGYTLSDQMLSGHFRKSLSASLASRLLEFELTSMQTMVAKAIHLGPLYPVLVPMRLHALSTNTRGALPPEERQRRFDMGLCLYCGLDGHRRDTCPRRQSALERQGNAQG